MKSLKVTLDGNEAAAQAAYLTNEVIAIYPITPSSPMGEFSDEWSSVGRTNLWGSVPRVVEMQSEGGAAGAIHGALQCGALTTTFTSSQGLLLMIPNMYKIAGELTPTVFHVASRSLAAQALSIFGDHSDVMAARSTGFAFLCAGSVQEVSDFALIAQAATLEGRIPVVHFFDGFRTSHEVSKIEKVEESAVRELLSDLLIAAHRARALSPEHPVLRGSSQNPDVYFQSREAVNPFYARFPSIVQEAMDRFAGLTGRRYRLFDYAGAQDAERVVILMGSGCEAVEEAVDFLQRKGEKVGLLKVRLFRPFDSGALVAALPNTAKKIAVLDRTKEPGADGEPLYKDVLSALAQEVVSGTSRFPTMPRVVGGRYGLSSKEFTPGMIVGIFDELKRDPPRNPFTVGIVDDLTHTSLSWDPAFRTDAHRDAFQAVFFGLGADGTVSANKNTIKIIGEGTNLYAQGYFVYDSKKSGAVTISHLRFGPKPIRAPYLIEDGDARFVACHQPIFLDRFDMLNKAAPGGIFLVNSPVPPDRVWETFPREMQEQIVVKKITCYAIDAYDVARMTGMGRRINTIMQTCFFAISGILPKDQAIAAIKEAVEKSYGKRGRRIVEQNFQAIDETLARLHLVKIPDRPTSIHGKRPIRATGAPDFVRKVTAELIAGRGDSLPVSLLPADGTFPVGTARYEKRSLALEIPVWEPDLCIQCGKCVFVCPHSVIRSKIFPPERAASAPAHFLHAEIRSKEIPEGWRISYQVAPDDCTGCTLCVDICPARDKSNHSRKAVNMAPLPGIVDRERINWDYFWGLPDYPRSQVKETTIPGAMLFQPLFEFSGACEGCGETPYLRLVSQLFGDRMVIANATGCTSIYGGNLPTTPWSANAEGRGPAWSNSLFEDNAEFGLGMRIAIDKQREYAFELFRRLSGPVGGDLASAILETRETNEAEIHEQRERVAELRRRLAGIDLPEARRLESVAENLCKKSVWIVGGDGWAYDIGFGGVDHVLASGRNVNLLVLDTEVYSNTGGQTSKATPIGAVAKFSAAGKQTPKKDLAMIAMSYEHVYVAQVAYGAKDIQTLHAFLEAESYDGPSLIIAYSPCIAHGYDLSHNHEQQDLAVKSGHWPLFRYDPRRIAKGENPLHLDSKPPSVPFRDYISNETRFQMLWRTHPEEAERLLKLAQAGATDRYHRYRQLAGLSYQKEG